MGRSNNRLLLFPAHGGLEAEAFAAGRNFAAPVENTGQAQIGDVHPGI
jgi:hypothetical protein